jgi:hypothetical protein
VWTCHLDRLLNSSNPTVTVTVTGDTVGIADSGMLVVKVAVGGVPKPGYRLTWSSSDPAVATVDGVGRVRGLLRGSATITAELARTPFTAAPERGTGTVRVVVPRLTVAPGDTTITSAGDTVCLRWAARDARGTTLPGVNPDSIKLAVDADSTLRLIAGGCVVARKSGTKATVRAALDTVTVTAGVTVSQQIVRLAVHPDTIRASSVTATVQLHDSAFDRRDSLIASPVLAWTSDNAAVATVDATAQVTSRGNGATWVRLSGNGKTDSVFVVVRQVTRQVTVSPVVDTLRAAGARRTLRAVAHDALGQPIPDAAFSWTSLAPNTVQLVASGMDTATFQAVTEGGASVDARGTAGGNAADTLARLEVRFTLSSVTLAPKQPVFSHVGDTLRFTATGRDANGATISNPSVIWSSSDTSKIVIDSISGLATARDSGGALIRGRHDASVQDTTTASVRPPVLAANTATVLDSAVRGSTTPVVTTRNVQNLGSVNLGVKARHAQSSAWLTITPDTLTLMPNEIKSLQLSADPTGLVDGSYQDTVVLQSVGAAGTPKRIPVALLVYCPVVQIAPDTLVTSSLTPTSCRSRERPTSNADYYSFTGSVGDTISVAMSAGGMDSYLYLLNTAGTAVASNDDCSSFTRNACITEYPVPATGNYTIEATTFSTATGSYTLVLSRVAAPTAATGLTQRDPSGPIVVTTGSSNAVLGATGHDPNPHDTLRLQVEFRDAATSLGGAPTDSSAPAPNSGTGVALSVSVSGLLDGHSYHWRARACDQTRRCGPWTNFSPDPAFKVTFTGPVLTVAPASVRDSALVGSSTTVMHTLAISNMGSAGTFNWTATKLKSWLSLNPNSGSGNGNVTLTLNPTGLTAGTYQDTVVVTAAGALGSPDTTVVTFVIQQPVLVVSPASISHSANANTGVTFRDTLHISNSGTGPLNWMATKDSTWLTFDNAANGSAPSNLALTITPGTRPAGTYTAHVTITAPGATGNPATIPVTLTVYRPVLAVSPNSVTDSANVGTTATRSTTLNVTNTGSGTLTWSTAASPNASWLSIVPSAGSAPGSATLTLTPTGLTAGTYSTTVVVTSPVANNSPINVPVQFFIRQPVLSVTPGTVSDTATLGVSPTKTATLTVANGDGGALAWRDSAAQRSSWLGLSPGSASAPGTITVSLNPANLQAGTHNDTVIVTSPGAMSSPARVSVQFNILRPPELPTGLGQFKSDGTTTVPIGGVTNESVATFKATVTDLDAGNMLKIQVEAKPVGTTFTNIATATSVTAVATGSDATAMVSGLVDDVGYHWQVRTCDQNNRCSGWVSFGGNPETAADFYANPNPEPPAAPDQTKLGQFQSDGTTPISTGGHTGGLVSTSVTVVLTGSVTDPDPLGVGDSISLHVEVNGGGSTYPATGTTVLSGNVSSATVTVPTGILILPISYTWRAQACNQMGLCSAWVSHGGSPDFYAP